jgi:hypothetical protein
MMHRTAFDLLRHDLRYGPRFEEMDPPADPPANPSPSSDDPPAPEVFKIKVDGKEMEVTREELITHAQKGVYADKKLSQTGQEMAELKKKAAVYDSLSAYRTSGSVEDYRKAMEALGYTKEEIDAEIPSPETPPANPQEKNVPEAEQILRDQVKALEERIESLSSLVTGREQSHIESAIRAGINADEYVKGALEGAEDEVKAERLGFLIDEATQAAGRTIAEARKAGKPYTPAGEAEVAKQAVEAAVGLAKRLGLNAPTPTGGAGLAPGDAPLSQPAPVDFGKANRADTRDWVKKFIAHAVDQNRRGQQSAPAN